MTYSLLVLRSASATAIGRRAGSADAKFYSALPQRLAGSRAEPLTRSHRPAASQARDHTPGRSTK